MVSQNALYQTQLLWRQLDARQGQTVVFFVWLFEHYGHVLQCICSRLICIVDSASKVALKSDRLGQSASSQ